MKYIIITIFFYTISVFPALAKENIRDINTSAPVGMNSLVNNIKSNFQGVFNEGEHGLKEYCYKKKGYIVYREDSMSQGYILSKNLPQGMKCFMSPDHIIEKNKLGIYIGMSKQKVEQLIGVPGLEDSQIIIWNSCKTINSERYNIMTYSTFKFQDNVLVYLRTTESITN